MASCASYVYLPDADWDERIGRADALARPCALCPRRCGVDRPAGERGVCEAGGTLQISSIFPHHGEEPPISGTGGSGTVFFSHCTLRCVFCQNWQISHEGEGQPFTTGELAGRMLWLQETGCHNVNWVTATHYLPWALRALREASRAGLTIPVVYNCGGYERVETLQLLDGIVDIYLPDMKYGADGPARRYSKAPDYVKVNQAAVREMFRQVGPLRLAESGIAPRGLCIRHLVLPEGNAGSLEILAFLSARFDPDDIFVSLMAQYHPCYEAHRFRELSRRTTPDEYLPIMKAYKRSGFGGYFQEMMGIDGSFLINFKERKSERLTGE